EADRLFRGPDAVRIETKGILGKGVRQRPIRLEFVIRMEHAAFQFVRGESEAALELAGVFHQLIDRANFARPRARIGMSKKTIRSEGNPLAQASAQKLANRHAPGLSEQIQTSELERR